MTFLIKIHLKMHKRYNIFTLFCALGCGQPDDPMWEEKRDRAVLLMQICRFFLSLKKEICCRKRLELSGADQYRKSENRSEPELLKPMEQPQKITNIPGNTSTGCWCTVTKMSVKRSGFDTEEMQNVLQKEEIQKIDSNENPRAVLWNSQSL